MNSIIVTKLKDLIYANQAKSDIFHQSSEFQQGDGFHQGNELHQCENFINMMNLINMMNFVKARFYFYNQFHRIDHVYQILRSINPKIINSMEIKSSMGWHKVCLVDKNINVMEIEIINGM